VKALDIIDEVIALIRGSKTTDEARKGLIEKLGFSEPQAQAILDMRLQRLTGLEREKLETELAQLLSDIERFQSILGNPKILDAVIKEELLDLKKRFGDERKTEIIEAFEELSLEDLIPESDIVVVLSQDGYLKRKDLEEYSLQGRGGKGRKGATLQEEDEIALVAVTETHQDIYLFTSMGRVFALRGYMIPESKSGRGKMVNRFIALEEGERVVAMHGRAVEGAQYAFFITKKGTAKRLDLSELKNLTRAGRRVLGLDEGDEIAQIVLTSGEDHLLIVTAQGQALRVEESEFRPMGRAARGVRGIRLAKGDYVIGCDRVFDNRWPLLLSEKGVGKRTHYDEFMLRHRGGLGVKVMNLSEKTGLIVGCWSVAEEDEIIAITSRGRMIRLAVAETPVLGRTARGSIMVRLDEGDTVADASVVSTTEDGDTSI
jgi:DNA gyrase subunit A